MSVFDLPIAIGYVPTWGVIEGFREIFQNAIDQQTLNPENRMIWSYDNETVRVVSKNSTLERSSLLLGHTTKPANDKMIGNFGEGYKLALLVFARNDMPVRILNYGRSEIWTPRIKVSKKFDASILSVETKAAFFREVPDGNLTFEIGGVDEAMWSDIKAANLHIRDEYPRHIECANGKIILDVAETGNLYVNGLLVCKTSLHYGYDLKPSVIKLDRDRSTVSSWDLGWETSRMWMGIADHHFDLFQHLLEIESADVEYAGSTCWGSDNVRARAFFVFQEKHGRNAIPASTEDEIKAIKKIIPAANVIIVGDSYGKVLQSSSAYKGYLKDHRSDAPQVVPKEALVKYLRKHKAKMGASQLKGFGELVAMSEFWADGRKV